MKLPVLSVALFSVIAIVAGAQAQAQNGTLTRSFVSSTGVDSNPCTIAQPCATFAVAYTKISANGIIAALDPGKYGSLNIIGPVTVNGNGWAAITGTSGSDAIEINVASGNVTLTGLELDGAGAGLHGVFLTSNLSANATLTIRDCIVSNFTGSGIAIEPTSSVADTYGYLLIANTFSINNGADGIQITPGGTARAEGTITQSVVANNNNNGFDIEGFSFVTVASSVATNNNSYGIYENLSANAELIVQDTKSNWNVLWDLSAAGSGDAWLSRNYIGSFQMGLTSL
jgi:hypothetical protein